LSFEIVESSRFSELLTNRTLKLYPTNNFRSTRETLTLKSSNDNHLYTIPPVKQHVKRRFLKHFLSQDLRETINL
jgi:hypothetical protein